MATFDDAAAIAAALPEVTEGVKFNHRTWLVGGKGFVWERPLSKADIKRYGDAPPPEGPLLAIATDGLHEKEAILAEATPGVFTIEHFSNYPALLIQLKVVRKPALRALITDAWLACAPDALADAYLASRRPKRRS